MMSNPISVEVDAALYFSCDNMLTKIICKKLKKFFTLTLCDPGGGPKDPQLNKSPNALKLVFKSGWNVFDFSYIDFMKLFNQKF